MNPTGAPRVARSRRRVARSRGRVARSGARSLGIVGGGPAGLFLARVVRLLRPEVSVDVYERNEAGVAFGFGVTLSDRTMSGLAQHDPQTHRRIMAASTALSGVEVRLPGHRLRYDGFGSAAISRRTLLEVLTEQAVGAGARVHFGQEVDPRDLGVDVVAFADGANSAARASGSFGTTVRTGRARYAWLGTTAVLAGVSALVFEPTEFGPMAVHCYPYEDGLSTVVVEMSEEVWRAAGLDTAVVPSHGADVLSVDTLNLLTEVFAEHLDGHKLLSNLSRWARFPVIRNQRWHDGNTVLLGDAAHTAHFTVSSGTKLALEDAIALAVALAEHSEPSAAFAAYELARRGPVSRIQEMSETSMHWWETFGSRMHLPPTQFGLNFVTRTGAISYSSLRRRCPARVDEAELEFSRESCAPDRESRVPDRESCAPDGESRVPPHANALAAPLNVSGVQLSGRLVHIADEQDGVVVLRAANNDAAVRFVVLTCPAEPEWTAAADDLVRQARELPDVDGVLLRSPGTWPELLAHADRVRNEARVPVAVEVPADWTSRTQDSTSRTQDSRSGTQDSREIYLALITGRIDLVVG